jgi:hypothetical protein
VMSTSIVSSMDTTSLHLPHIVMSGFFWGGGGVNPNQFLCR